MFPFHKLCLYPLLSQISFARTMIQTISIVIQAQTLLFCVSLAEIWIHQSLATPWLPLDQLVLEQTKLMTQQGGTKHSYKLFSLLNIPLCFLVWRPHSTVDVERFTGGLPVANFLWPQTQVVYLWNAPTNRSLYITYNSCNMGVRDLPDMYAQSPRAAGPRTEGICDSSCTTVV